MSFFIRGVHPVEAPEPCHLIEAELTQGDSFDWGNVTQEVPGQPRTNWQVPWDERPLDKAETRWVFFFHYLDLERPLLTPESPVELPAETPLPQHLTGIEYESPC
jgi:hypothetical protein